MDANNKAWREALKLSARDGLTPAETRKVHREILANIRCAICDAPAGEVTLVRLSQEEKDRLGLDGDYVCKGGCLRQRDTALKRLLGGG